jgi:hypothetical protein
MSHVLARESKSVVYPLERVKGLSSVLWRTVTVGVGSVGVGGGGSVVGAELVGGVSRGTGLEVDVAGEVPEVRTTKVTSTPMNATTTAAIATLIWGLPQPGPPRGWPPLVGVLEPEADNNPPWW